MKKLLLLGFGAGLFFLSAQAQAASIKGYDVIDLDTNEVVHSFSPSLTEWTLYRPDLPQRMSIVVRTSSDVTMVRTQLMDETRAKKREDGSNYQIDDKKAPFSVSNEKNGKFSPLILNGKDEYSLLVYAYADTQKLETDSIKIIMSNESNSAKALGAVKVYPFAANFSGSSTSGGRGGKVCKVTTLEDKTAIGTLRNCVTQKEPTNVVFEVGGTIKLTSPLVLASNLTIFGQTAPSPGITLYGNTLRVGGHNVLIQHLRIRLGDKAGQRDAVEMTYYSDKKNGVATCNKPAIENVIFDHVSISWAIDGSFDIQPLGCPGKVNNIALTNSFVSEHLENSVHGEGAHSFAVLVGHHSRNVTFLNNMFAHNKARNPRIDSNVTANVINNFMYNTKWHGVEVRNASSLGELPTTLNVVNNILGAPTNVKLAPMIQVQSRPGYVKRSIYATGNLAFGYGAKPLNILRANNVPSNEPNLTEADIYSMTPVSSLTGLNIEPADLNLRTKILEQSGARPFDRDIIDSRMLKEVSEWGGSLIDRPRADEVAYLEKMALTPTRRSFPNIDNPANDDNLNGWSNLEEYIYKTYK